MAADTIHIAVTLRPVAWLSITRDEARRRLGEIATQIAGVSRLGMLDYEVDVEIVDPEAERLALEADRPQAARDVPPGQSWAFTDHRTLAEVYADEGVAS